MSTETIDNQMSPLLIAVTVAVVLSLACVLYGVYRAHQECGVGNSSFNMLMTYNSLNPISAEAYLMQCRELN